jgi:hypothetical protein
MSVGVPVDCGTQSEICIHARKHARAHKQAPLTHQTQARVCQFAFVVCVCVLALCACESWFVRFVCVSVGVPVECGTQAEIRIQARKHAQAHKQAQTRTSILRFLRDMFLLPPNRAGKKFAPKMGGLLSRDPNAYEQFTLLSATCRDPKGLMENKRTKQKHVVSIRALCVRVLALCACKSWFVRFLCVCVCQLVCR